MKSISMKCILNRLRKKLKLLKKFGLLLKVTIIKPMNN